MGAAAFTWLSTFTEGILVIAEPVVIFTRGAIATELHAVRHCRQWLGGIDAILIVPIPRPTTTNDQPDHLPLPGPPAEIFPAFAGTVPCFLATCNSSDARVILFGVP
jgi:hypothetical protein